MSVFTEILKAWAKGLEQRPKRDDEPDGPYVQHEPERTLPKDDETRVSLYKCKNGRILEMWVPNPKARGNHFNDEENMIQSIYLVQEDDNLAEIIALALVTGKLQP